MANQIIAGQMPVVLEDGTPNVNKSNYMDAFHMKTKSMQGTGANMLTKKGIVATKIKSIVLPSKDTDTAIKELGAMITDIQKLGDFAIEKWQA